MNFKSLSLKLFLSERLISPKAELFLFQQVCRKSVCQIYTNVHQTESFPCSAEIIHCNSLSHNENYVNYWIFHSSPTFSLHKWLVNHKRSEVLEIWWLLQFQDIIGFKRIIIWVTKLMWTHSPYSGAPGSSFFMWHYSDSCLLCLRFWRSFRHQV
jgi:hypothetical protein